MSDIRTSYDTVAESYADQVRHLLDDAPYEQAVLALFANLVRASGSEGGGSSGGGPVADVGCGPGRITAYLHEYGLDAFGIDLSPAMIDVARRENPDLRFEVGSMTDLRLDDASLAGLIAWYSLIHIPDDVIGQVFAEFRRVVRPGGPILVGFHVGVDSRLKTEGYGGHPMNVYVHRRQPARVASWLEEAGLRVEAQMTLSSRESSHAGILFARRNP